MADSNVAPRPRLPRRWPTIPFSPTREGWAWLALAVFLVQLRAFNLVVLLGCLMLALWVVGAVALLLRPGLGAIRVRRGVPEPVFAGEPFTVTLEVTNTGYFRQRGVHLHDVDVYHNHRMAAPDLAPGQTDSDYYSVTLPRPGQFVWAPVEITTTMPFGLFRRRKLVQTGETTIVLPRLGHLNQGRLLRRLRGSARAVVPPRRQLARRTASPADFYGVREFRPGDSPRWIHWRSTARTGIPMVREFEEPPAEHLVIVVDPWLPKSVRELSTAWSRARANMQEAREMLAASRRRMTPEAYQRKATALAKEETPFRQPLDDLARAVSLAATLCVAWTKQSAAQVVLVVAESPVTLQAYEAGPRTFLPLLERLAVIVGSPHPAEDEAARVVAEADLPPGPVIVVSTRNSPLAARIEAILRRPVTLIDMAHDATRDFFATDAEASLH